MKNRAAQAQIPGDGAPKADALRRKKRGTCRKDRAAQTKAPGDRGAGGGPYRNKKRRHIILSRASHLPSPPREQASARETRAEETRSPKEEAEEFLRVDEVQGMVELCGETEERKERIRGLLEICTYLLAEDLCCERQGRPKPERERPLPERCRRLKPETTLHMLRTVAGQEVRNPESYLRTALYRAEQDHSGAAWREGAGLGSGT